jgi:DNA-directed RNA polymerase specialized sigma24 family protein
MALGKVRRSANRLTSARESLAESLRELEGAKRREGLRIAQEVAGLQPHELAELLGVSRQRIHQQLQRGE